MQRANSEEIQHWFLTIDYLAVVETVVKEDSWNWMATRNGFVAASIWMRGLMTYAHHINLLLIKKFNW